MRAKVVEAKEAMREFVRLNDLWLAAEAQAEEQGNDDATFEAYRAMHKALMRYAEALADLLGIDLPTARQLAESETTDSLVERLVA